MAGPEERTYGVLGEFETADELVAAAGRAWAAGYRHLNAYSPFPVEGLPHMLGYRAAILPLLGLAGVLVGAGLMYGLQYWTNAIDYPINVGGRPLHSWPTFLPQSVIVGILFGAVAMIFGMLALNRLPELDHPIFNVEAFARASQDRFFLCIRSDDPRYVEEQAAKLLREAGGCRVDVVPW
jgi:hypothetical protein